MAHPDHALWEQGWRAHQIPFHLPHVHPLLLRFWPRLGLDCADRVFVPLCGKSLDLNWLHAGGHAVVGVELSPVAVREFFKASRLHPGRRHQGELTRWVQGRMMIYCGDFFALRREDLLGVRAVYDRGALTALPENLRAGYIAHLHAILPADCRMMLITIEDLDDDEDSVANMAASAEIMTLYAARFSVELLHAEFHPALVASAGVAADSRCIHKVYGLRRTGPVGA